MRIPDFQIAKSVNENRRIAGVEAQKTAFQNPDPQRQPSGTHLIKNSAFRFGMQLALLPGQGSGLGDQSTENRALTPKP